jgi:cell division protein ZapB
MSNRYQDEALEDELGRLETSVEELLSDLERAREEIGSLRAQQEQLTLERAKLIEHNELARSRVEAMVTRLKALEQES